MMESKVNPAARGRLKLRAGRGCVTAELKHSVDMSVRLCAQG